MENNKYSQYEDYFRPELDELSKQSKENDKLYGEVHKSLEKNLERIDGKMMFGGSSPHRDVAELGKVLNDIRGNQIAIIKEKSNIKKNIIDLDIRKTNSRVQAAESNNTQALMREALMEINRKLPDINKPTVSEINNKKGKEELKKLDPKDLGLNENDYTMIAQFKQGRS